MRRVGKGLPATHGRLLAPRETPDPFRKNVINKIEQSGAGRAGGGSVGVWPRGLRRKEVIWAPTGAGHAPGPGWGNFPGHASVSRDTRCFPRFRTFFLAPESGDRATHRPLASRTPSFYTPEVHRLSSVTLKQPSTMAEGKDVSGEGGAGGAGQKPPERLLTATRKRALTQPSTPPAASVHRHCEWSRAARAAALGPCE